ncbi:MAG TPA: ATP-binding protein [Blastocatellia bacterium]|nr:ATP-binding protein [Blastocatellia bacterium]
MTLWYLGMLGLALVVFSAGVYWLLDRDLSHRMDQSLRASAESIALSLLHERAEGETEEEAAASSVREIHLLNQAVAIFDAKGRLFEEKTAPGGAHARLPPIDQIPVDSLYIFTAGGENGSNEGQRVATRRVKIDDAHAPYLVSVSQPLETVTDGLNTLRRSFLIAVPLALLLAGLGGFFLARKSLAPVVEMSEQARQISAENLDQRLPVANPRDELGRLADVFNELLSRLDASFSLQRQFMADASHELRTPLSVVRTATQVTLEMKSREEGEYRDALATIDDQTRRLSRIVDDMFTMARADSGRRPLTLCNIYLDELINETTRAAGTLAASKGVMIEAARTPEALYHGDEDLLRQMLMNLLDNAIKHTPPGGLIRVNLAKFNSIYQVVVADTGEGIPAESQPHIFKRFYRVDKSRSRSNGYANANGSGAGLGLPIALWIAEAHGGTIKLIYSDPAGSAFAVTLPIQPLDGVMKRDQDSLSAH